MVMIVLNWFPNSYFVEAWGIRQISFILDTDGSRQYCSINESMFMNNVPLKDILL